MSFTAYVPGMKPGSTIRNIVVAFVYLVFFPLIPFVLAIVVGMNRRGIADALAGVPGVSEGGGLMSAAVVFIISLVVVSMFIAVLPGDETGDIPEPEGGPGDTDGADDTEAGDGSGDGDGDGSESDGGNVSDVEEDVDVEEAVEDDTEDKAEAEIADEVEDEQLSEDEMEQVFQLSAEQQGLEVTSADHTSGEFEVEYTSRATTEEELAEEIGYFSGAYTVVVNEGHGGERMTVQGHSSDGQLAYSFQVVAEWAQAWYDNEMDDEEFFSRILDTIETYE